jgi:uncharacterized protein YqgC (DUF456 family)
MGEPLNTIALIVTLLLMIVGLIGTVAPVIPGTILIFLGALIYAVVEGFQAIGWPTLVLLGILTIIATTAEIWASSVGAKVGGASGWSMVVGVVAGLVGFVVFNFVGAIVGTVLGVLGAELVRVGDVKKALKAGSGWLIGWALSTVLQLVIGLSMAAIFVWQVAEGTG